MDVLVESVNFLIVRTYRNQIKICSYEISFVRFVITKGPRTDNVIMKIAYLFLAK